MVSTCGHPWASQPEHFCGAERPSSTVLHLQAAPYLTKWHFLGPSPSRARPLRVTPPSAVRSLTGRHHSKPQCSWAKRRLRRWCSPQTPDSTVRRFWMIPVSTGLTSPNAPRSVRQDSLQGPPSLGRRLWAVPRSAKRRSMELQHSTVRYFQVAPGSSGQILPVVLGSAGRGFPGGPGILERRSPARLPLVPQPS